MPDHLAWYVARSTGVVAWGLLVAAMAWGLAAAAHGAGARSRPWWVLGVHRFLGGLSVTFVVVHAAAIVADTYTRFTLVDVLVPLAAAWRPLPVALGIVAAEVLVAVQVTSVLQRRLPRRVWRHVHLASYGAFGLATGHAVTAGTDVGVVVGGGLAAAVAVVAIVLAGGAWAARRAPERVSVP